MIALKTYLLSLTWLSLLLLLGAYAQQPPQPSHTPRLMLPM